MGCFTKIFIHLVWKTKGRQHILRDRLEKHVHDVTRSTIRELDMVPICVNSAWSHTHALVSWTPTVRVDDAVGTIKGRCSRQWNEQIAEDGTRLEWQVGYSAFSVSPGEVDRVKQYIAKQKDLHADGGLIDAYEPFDEGDGD